MTDWLLRKKSLPSLEEFALVLSKSAMLPALAELAMLKLSMTIAMLKLSMTKAMVTSVTIAMGTSMGQLVGPVSSCSSSSTSS